MKDRQPTQILSNGAIRYGVYTADGTLDHYVYLKREDAPTVEGTPLNKANLLSDATAAKIWPGSEKPEDPTVNDALAKLAQGTARVGDIAITSRTDLSAAWLPCDGRTVSQEQYPALCAVLRTPASPSLWTQETVSTNIGAGGDAISYENGHWFRTYRDTTSAHILVSDDGETWTEWAMPQNLWVGGTIISSKIAACCQMHYYGGQYVCSALLKYTIETGTRFAHVILFADTLMGTFSADSPQNTNVTSAEDFEGSRYDIHYNGTQFIIAGYTSGTHSVCLLYTRNLSSRAANTGEYTNWSEGVLYAGDDDIKNVQGIYVARSTGEIFVYGRDDVDSSGFYDMVLFAGSSADAMNRLYVDNFTVKKANYPAAYGFVEVNNNVFTWLCIWVDSANSSTYKLHKISTNDGTITITKVSDTIDAPAYTVVCSDQLVGVYGTSVYVSEDITQGWDYTTTLPASAGGQPAAAGTVVRIPGTSANTAVKDILHNFAYDNKKIPTITTDTRSKAYIKALEE